MTDLEALEQAELAIREKRRIWSIAWANHHKRRRSSWGWQSDHNSLKAYRDQIETELEQVRTVYDLIEDPTGTKTPDSYTGR